MMSPETPPSAITRIHRQMLDQLAELDRLGEHVAAAHLTAAIDALEDRLDGPRTASPRDRRDDPVEVMAHALVQRLGARATDAARQQMQGATGQVLLVWAAIVSHIDQLQGVPAAAGPTLDR